MLQIFEFFFLLYLNLSYESSSQNRRITWSLSFCWFRHAQSATRKYLDELRGSRQILQLHRWQLHTLGPCNVIMWDETSWDPLLMKTVCWFTLAANCTWSCLEDASINLLSSQIDKCMCTVLRLPVFCLWNQGGFLFFWESKAGVVQYYDMYCMSLYFPHFYMIWFWEEKKDSVLWVVAGANAGMQTQQNILDLGLVFSVWLVVQTNSTDCQQN